MTDRELIRMHLEEYLREILPGKTVPSWNEVLAFCVGYYGHVNLDMISVVRELQWEGKVE